jgi:poly(A) polymerase
MSQTPGHIISAAGFPAYLYGFSAIDSYLGRDDLAAVYVSCRAGLADLARLFDGLRYPGFADAAVDSGGKTWYFECEDSEGARGASGAPNLPGHCGSFGFLEFYQDCATRRFYDPNGVYPLLRQILGGGKTAWEDGFAKANAQTYRALFDGAMLLARYFPETSFKDIKQLAAGFSGLEKTAPPGMEEQRLLLAGLLNAANPAPGFELLKMCGFIATFWPELAVLDDVDQSKEFHPEGNVWKHTMETLRYRKAGGQGTGFDLRLSLGLLLHDVGKPLSDSAGSRRFDGHAELGERQARRFLDRLGFGAPLARDVCYLVRNHMLPAALPRLPLARTGEIMSSLLFPLLLELYRCDESSSFKGLDGYYESSAAYKSYLKHCRNPYRTADGKKLKREQVMRHI